MNIDFEKYSDGLVPVIVQDYQSNVVLMLGYMNKKAVEKTLSEGKITFFSRSKQRLWTKGETSGNFLVLKDIKVDCDNDAILVKAEPIGPTCHTGADTCFNEQNKSSANITENRLAFLEHLETVIGQRKNNPSEKSYTSSLFAKGINKVAQKVGEEAVEVVIEAKDNNDELFLGEAADLMFHYLILLQAKGFTLTDVIEVLKQRHK
jgi:phosphoribosyl-ATP pyrophosphohydrolase/phosphoribosyl-AMP cyclohydrolase